MSKMGPTWQLEWFGDLGRILARSFSVYSEWRLVDPRTHVSVVTGLHQAVRIFVGRPVWGPPVGGRGIFDVSIRSGFDSACFING